MNNHPFDTWLDRIDAILEASIGLTHSDLPDAPYADRFYDDVSPGDAALEFATDWWKMPDDVYDLIDFAVCEAWS